MTAIVAHRELFIIYIRIYEYLLCVYVCMYTCVRARLCMYVEHHNGTKRVRVPSLTMTKTSNGNYIVAVNFFCFMKSFKYRD